MTKNLDVAFVERLPALTHLSSQLQKAVEGRRQNEANQRRSLPAPNLAELCLLAARGRRTVATWLLQKPTSIRPLPVEKLLVLRAELAQEIEFEHLVPNNRVQLLATYLATTTCPQVSTLADFAEVNTKTARSWLRRLADQRLLLLFATSSELFFLNSKLISIISGFDHVQIESQFDLLVRQPRWLRHSHYRHI